MPDQNGDLLVLQRLGRTTRDLLPLGQISSRSAKVNILRTTGNPSPPNIKIRCYDRLNLPLAAAAGASTRELMHRMGHGSMRAALIYQHATSERIGRSPIG
ncbi:hypothetical protein GCM10022243_25210 [Saccharothrix violaceirubra]|uniref:Tyr recombinase domain-containing protein n=1 Tax=Saccharothrix violaceirubra TaxID=413306 RepID=A0A7W7WYG1_9PSEU|nr:hypothetical protein [Saccharothrix violaceirubra]MBB4967966.1 hypothetical protein [Saccharothrix violaceirubra]